MKRLLYSLVLSLGVYVQANSLTNQCSSTLVQSLSRVNQPINKTDEMLLFSKITSVKLTPNCAYNVVKQLAQKLSSKSSTKFKVSFLFLAKRHHKDFKALTNHRYKQMQKKIAQALKRILHEIKKSHLRGNMLSVMIAYRINLLRDIRTIVDYSSLNIFLQDWQFNQYAACMGEKTAFKRMTTILSKSDAPALRLLFTEISRHLSHKDVCLPYNMIHTLVKPYLNDHRVTHDVDGDGLPVSYYANRVKVLLNE